MSSQITALQKVEMDLFQQLVSNLETRCMIDVGAHHGSTLAPFLEDGWQVVAFEPVEDSRSQLMARWGACPRLTVRSEAVSDQSGTASMHLAIRPDGTPHDYYHSLEQTQADRYHRKGAVITVPLVSLDDLIRKGAIAGRIGFLKIDTEGHDLAVLRGASRLECEVVSVEFWRDRHPLGRSPSPAEEVVRLLAERDYDSYLVLCHHGDGTFVQGSSLVGLPADSWGNLLFFHRLRLDLYQRLLAKLKTSPPVQGRVAIDGRLLSLLQLAFSGRQDLVVVHTGPESDAWIQGLRAQFPQTYSLWFGGAASTVDDVRAGTAGRRVDLVRISASALTRAVLRGATATLTGDRPAVLVHVVFAASPSQNELSEALACFQESDYRFAGVYDAMISHEGILSEADVLFLPAELHCVCAKKTRFFYENPEALLEQARTLQHACDERLEALERIHKQSGILQQACDDMRKQNQILQRACDERLETLLRLRDTAEERLQLINLLDAEVTRLRNTRPGQNGGPGTRPRSDTINRKRDSA